VRNGTRPKAVLTEGSGRVGIEVPRDRQGTFEPQIVKKRQRRLTGVDEIVLSLYAKGLTTGEISAHFAEIYGASVSKETISRITDKVVAEMTDWCSRPLDEVYAAIFIDAVMVKVRDGQVASRPVYAAIGVTLAGEKDILGLWAGTGGEGAKFWMSVLTDLRNRGVKDVFFVVCDGLKGLPEVVGNAWPQAIVQTCVVHLIRNTFHLASKRDWDALKHDIKPIYTAVNAEAARAALDELADKRGQRYPVIIRLWQNAWEQFIPFLDYDVEIRKVLCSTNAIESLNARYRRAVKARGHFPTEQAALKCLYLGHPVPGPDRDRPHPVGNAMEARSERLRHHLRRPVPGRRDLLTQMPETPLVRQTPAGAVTTDRGLRNLGIWTWQPDRGVLLRWPATAHRSPGAAKHAAYRAWPSDCSRGRHPYAGTPGSEPCRSGRSATHRRPPWLLCVFLPARAHRTHGPSRTVRSRPCTL
jgi:putative transposase